MIVCGCEIAAQEIRVAVCELNNGEVVMKPLATTRIEIKDDTNDLHIKKCLEDIKAFAAEYGIDKFTIKARMRKGKMAGGAATFKLETLVQLVDGCETQFVPPQTLASYAKNEIDGYPEKLPVYLKNAYVAGVYGLLED